MICEIKNATEIGVAVACMSMIVSINAIEVIQTSVISYSFEHIHTGREEFRSGGWSLLFKYIFHCLHKKQVVLPEYYLFFCPKIAIWKILGGLQPNGPYAYDFEW